MYPTLNGMMVPADRTTTTILSEANLTSLAEQVTRFLADSHPGGGSLSAHLGYVMLVRYSILRSPKGEFGSIRVQVLLYH